MRRSSFARLPIVALALPLALTLAAVPGQEWFLSSGWTGNTIDDYEIVAVDPNTGQCEPLINHGSSPKPIAGRHSKTRRSLAKTSRSH